MSDNISQYKNLISSIEKIGKEIKMTYKYELKVNGTFASGNLYNSINYRVEKTEKGIKLFFVSDKYWINIENGRRAGAKLPPIDLIKKWIYQKGLIIKKGQTKSGVAFLIARSIAEKGIKPKPYLNNMIKSEKVNWVKLLQTSFEKDLHDKVITINKNIKNRGNKNIKFK